MKKNALGQISDLEIKQLKIFKAVTECGGFSAAETNLNVSRPTISNHIAALEARLNIKLCKRGRSGFALTREGNVVYEQTCQLLEQMDTFRNSINNMTESPTGTLRISLSDSIATDERCRFAEILKSYTAAAPDVEIQLNVEHMSEMEKKVLKKQIDIAIIPFHRKLYGLNYIHLYTDTHLLYCGQLHPLFNVPESDITSEILNQQKVVHAGLNPHEEVYNHLSEMHTAAASYYYETRIPMLLSGEYIGFLPEHYAQPYIERGLLKALCESRKHFKLGITVISKKSNQPKRIRELFLDVIRNTHQIYEDTPPY